MFDLDSGPKAWKDGERDAAIHARWRGFLLRHGGSYTKAVKSQSYYADETGEPHLGWPQRMSYDMALNRRLLCSPLNTLCNDPIAMPHMKHRWLQGLALTVQWPDTPANREALTVFVKGLSDGDLARHVSVKLIRVEDEDEPTVENSSVPDKADSYDNDAYARCGLRITGADMNMIRTRLNRLMQAVPNAAKHPVQVAEYEIRPQDIGRATRQR